MKNRVRIESNQDLVTNTAISILGTNDEWVDIRRVVSGVTVTLKVGEISRAHLDLLPAEIIADVCRLDDETQEAFASVLRAHGWKAERAPEIRPVARPLVETTHFGSKTREYVHGLEADAEDRSVKGRTL